MEKKQEKELTKDKATICKNTVPVNFVSYAGSQIPYDATVKIQEFGGNRLKITHTKNPSTNLKSIKRLSADEYLDKKQEKLNITLILQPNQKKQLEEQLEKSYSHF